MSTKKKLVLAFFLLCGDQGAKFIFFDKAVVNTGGVFGLAQGFWWEVAIAPLLLYVVFIWMKEKKQLTASGLTLLAAGGVGNIIDRLKWGGVIDFIHYPVLGFTGNVADLYLAVAVILIFYDALRAKA